MNADFYSLVKSRTIFRLFLFTKLPAAFFSGIKIESASAESCTASVPYKWFTTNPFRSTYFACLAMAAEMSTGVLAMAKVYKQTPPVSMLVQGLRAEYLKKATGRIRFTCNDGAEISRLIEETRKGGEPKTIEATSIGTNSDGEVVAKFYITWTFKRKAD